MSTDTNPATVAQDQADAVDLGEMLAELTERKPADGDGPAAPAIAGTVALYPDGAGGLVIVMDVAAGGMMPAGVHRAHLPRQMIRMVTKLASLRAMMGGRRGHR